jgi:hypothetical protein
MRTATQSRVEQPTQPDDRDLPATGWKWE